METVLEESLNDLIELDEFDTANKILENVRSTFSKYDEYKIKIDQLKEKTNV